MSLIRPMFEPGDKMPTRAYGGCSCFCHRSPNVYHIMPCCGPGRDLPLEDLPFEIEVIVEPITKD